MSRPASSAAHGRRAGSRTVNGGPCSPGSRPGVRAAAARHRPGPVCPRAGSRQDPGFARRPAGIGLPAGHRTSRNRKDSTAVTGVAQEIYALLTCYQILRIAITDAIETAGGIDPGRGSFTIALNAARDLFTQAANVIVATMMDLIGDIGRRVLASLLPDRRLRVSPRIVKRAISKFQARGPNINRRSYKATLDINILAAPGP